MAHDQEVYFVKQDYGKRGFECIIDYDRCSKAQVLADLASGEYPNAVNVFYLNIAEGNSGDVTDDFMSMAFNGIAAE